ncbi:glycine zipper family protein [Herminiimonas sp. CN]|uniref:glycine zipper family protein n=1 Tax=Herminiimonas sp. CN TaxID=1349818 RepID=UPI0004739FFF|nr:glycine zipper family protein [Herminiimonas sp. CN]
MSNTLRYTPLFALLLLSACVSMPSGPSMLVLPGAGKNFDQFRADEGSCRQYAQYQMGGATADQAAVDSGVRSAALGTVLGAAAGAAINGRSGAGTGAGVGLLYGGLAGTGAANSSGYGAQQRYDFAYLQCMYAKGHRVPVSGRFSNEMRNEVHTPGKGYAVPPPNTPPPSSY